MDMATLSDPAIVEKLSRRIDELGTKNARLLLFLSIAMVAVATLKAAKSSSELGWTLHWWKLALIPILIGMLPVRELGWESESWYEAIRRTRFVLLWIAIVLIFVGVFLLMAAIELIRPKRRLSVSKARRWLTNLGIAGVDTLVLRLMAAPRGTGCGGRRGVLRAGAQAWLAQPGRLALLAQPGDRAVGA